MIRSFILTCLITITFASDVKKVVKTETVSYNKGYNAPKAFYTDRTLYYGQYSGKCSNDGFYYNDYASFVICSNGNAYIQPCAAGSQNSAYGHYADGNKYYYRDFCDVNLVDDGYNKHGYGGNYAFGYDAGYQRPAYGAEPNVVYGYPEGHRGYSGKAYGGSYQKTKYTAEYAAPAPYH